VVDLEEVMKKERQESMKRTESMFRATGNDKCSICKFWMDKEHITNGVCDSH